MSSVSYFIPKGCRFLFDILKYDTVDTSGIDGASSWFRVLQSGMARGSVAFQAVSRGLPSDHSGLLNQPVRKSDFIKIRHGFIKIGHGFIKIRHGLISRKICKSTGPEGIRTTCIIKLTFYKKI